MASRLTPIGWIAKFLIAPVAVGALGYFVIGPRVGAGRPAPRLPITLPAPLAPQDAKPTAPVQDGPPPGVEVSVKPTTSGGPNLGQDSDSSSSGSDDNPKPRVRAGHHPPSMVAPPTDPQPDQDGSTGQ